MRIRRLGWAGIEVIADGHALVVDYVRDFPLLTSTVPNGAYAAHSKPAVAALVTHLHEDHCDVAAIESAVGPGGIVLRPPPFAGTADEAAFTEPNEERLSATGLDVRVAAEWQHVELGPFTVTAVPAVDGLGDPQLNWVVDVDGQRILHGGDTIFHGSWWLIARRLGPIDVAVLPINGAVVQAPHLRPPSLVPAVLTPAQAVRAAVILGAYTVLPIHFGVHQPPEYVEERDAVAQLVEYAAGQSLTVLNPEPGEEIVVDGPPPRR
ncbi:MBL fold metallo-hydrolase [Mycobacterium sp. NPDC003449]